MSPDASQQGALCTGDRVRVVATPSPYTGCRGTVAESPYPVPEVRSGEPLGYYVTIDGENGRATPFLAVELERVRVARVRRADSVPSSSSAFSPAASLSASGALAGSGESERR